MELAQNDWGQGDIINKITILIKQGTYMIHAVITMKYQKYPSTTILKHVNVLAKVNKLTKGRLLNMTPYDAYIITIHVLKITPADISHEQKE